MVEAEHAPEEAVVHAAQQTRERIPGPKWGAILVEQSVPHTLAPDDFERLPVMLEDPADPQGAVLMEKIVGRPGGNAEEKPLDGGQGGGLAGLVGTVDDV